VEDGSDVKAGERVKAELRLLSEVCVQSVPKQRLTSSRRRRLTSTSTDTGLSQVTNDDSSLSLGDFLLSQFAELKFGLGTHFSHKVK